MATDYLEDLMKSTKAQSIKNEEDIEEENSEDNYDDDYTDDIDADLIDDDYADLTIVDDEELEDEN